MKIVRKPKGRPKSNIDYSLFRQFSFNMFIDYVKEKTDRAVILECQLFYSKYLLWCIENLAGKFPSIKKEKEYQLFGKKGFYAAVSACCSNFIVRERKSCVKTIKIKGVSKPGSKATAFIYRIYPNEIMPFDNHYSDNNVEINNFISFIKIKNNGVTRINLYEYFISWASDNNYKYIGKKNFFDEIRKTGKFTERRISGEWCFVPCSTEIIEKEGEK